MPSQAYILAISTSSDYMATCSSPGLQNHHEVQNSAVDELLLGCNFGFQTWMPMGPVMV